MRSTEDRWENRGLLEVCSIRLPNALHGHLVPPEDSVAFADGVYCVADGITRDPRSGSFAGVPDEELFATYPNPSGARLAADVFCETFCNYAKSEAVVGPSLIRRAFLRGNGRIAELNERWASETDYLENDLYGCVACGCVIEGESIYWGNIGDTGIVVFSGKGERRLESQNGMRGFEEYSRSLGMNWKMADSRRFIRMEFRNKPRKFVGTERVGYGALTGESEAESFMEFGEYSIAKGDLVLLFTDGMLPVLRHPELFNRINRASKSEIEQSFIPWALLMARSDAITYGKERTMLVIRI